ncbi:MAG: AAA family ATPase [Gammaproteobacteria bacterium]|nr:AAA family ATPase [Gammaproteobacteria bacterium]
MYLQYFNMTEMPFSLLPDTSFFYESDSFKEALNVLLVAIRSGEGFVKVTGEVGTGKTMLCRKLLNCLEDENSITVYIPNPFLAPNQLRMALADELGVKYLDNASDDVTSYRLMSDVTKKLMEYNDAGKRVIVCLDEVQAMPVETLEALRLFSNIETEKNKLMQIILFGQPELDERLDNNCNRQLKQRISFSYKLEPVDRKRLSGYINHRLKIAGYSGDDLFSKKAIDKIHKSSNGVPRIVNTLCNKALILAFGQGQRNVISKHVKQAINDIEEEKNHNKIILTVVLATFVAVVVVLLLWVLIK